MLDNINNHIINPVYSLTERNVFNLRKENYETILQSLDSSLDSVRELGFDVTQLEYEQVKSTSKNLLNTIKKKLKIVIQKEDKEIDLSILVPDLIDDNFIQINGRRKVPFFQLYDIPFITRKGKIKFRSNMITIEISDSKKDLMFSYMKKKIPMSILVAAYYGKERCLELFGDIVVPEKIENGTHIEKLAFAIKKYFVTREESTQEDLVRDLGNQYSKIAPAAKGDMTLYSLRLIPVIDQFVKKYLGGRDLMDVILELVMNPHLDDMDFRNKRIRCFEYMVTSKIEKILFDFCLTNRGVSQKRLKFNINSTKILSDCNVSSVVQFDFSINPIEELTKLTRTTITGDGGFNKENIPAHLRDMDDSMLGRICPVDTPDRENCGVLQNLIPNTETILDDNWQFNNNQLLKQPISIPVSMVPFLANDDQTRLQMSSSQMRQGIMLKNFDKPIIQSGCEHLYSKHTSFLKVAKEDGKVIFKDEKFIFVEYVNSEIDIFDVSFRLIYTTNIDFFKVYVSEGDTFKKGDILAESNYMSNGVITIGKNLLTGVIVYYGHNYEDGIVISDRLVEDGSFTSIQGIDLTFTVNPQNVLMSIHDDRYQPLPNIMEKVMIGKPYAKIKGIPSESINFADVFREEKLKMFHKNLIFTEIKIFANEWNTDIPEYSKWIEDQIEKQKEDELKIQNVMYSVFSKNDATKIIREKGLNVQKNVGQFQIKDEKIDGVLIQMSAVYEKPIQIGDKIGNRHGNKGVIAEIVPHEKMPRIEDGSGRHLDICINPLGIISRMNIGQLFELHLAMAIDKLKQHAGEILDTDLDPRKFILDFYKIIDNTEGNWYYNQLEKLLPQKLTHEDIENLYVVAPPFESTTVDQVKAAIEYVGSQFKYNVFDPIAGINLLNPVSVGFSYFFRMSHIAEEKLAARGLGNYSRKTCQPAAGKKNQGGQRLGEMEVAALIGHEAVYNLEECMTVKSDCITAKNNYIKSLISPDLEADKLDEIDRLPESIKLLNAYLTVTGVSVE